MRFTVNSPASLTVAGDAAGEGDLLVLFVPGNSSTRTLFQPQLAAARLRGRSRLVAVDIPGSVATEAFPPEVSYSPRNYGHWLEEVVARLGHSEVVLVGHSLGGNIILQYLARHPAATVRGVVLIGTVPAPGDPRQLMEGFRPHPDLGLIFEGDLSAEAQRRLAGLTVQGTNPPPDAVIAAVAASDPRARAELGAHVQAGDFADEMDLLAAIEVPVALVVGEDDGVVNTEALRAVRLARPWRGGLHVVPQAGHAPHWQAPEAVNALLAAFVEETASAAAASL